MHILFKVNAFKCFYLGWSTTGSMNDGRHFHTATLLTDGKVLVIGGFYHGPLSSA
jgi:hypothetical protein